MLFCSVVVNAGDVLSGTSSSGEHHYGIFEGWFGVHWWTGRTFIVLLTTFAIFAPLASFKRIGECYSFIWNKKNGSLCHLVL